MRKTDIKLENRKGEDVTYKDVSSVRLDTPDGNAVFSLGRTDTLVVDPDFFIGNIELDAPDDALYEKVIVQRPPNLSAENIAKDVVVAGITGTFEGKQELPKLYTPSISRSNETINISNPGSNGSFSKQYNIYSNDELFFSLTSSSFSILDRFESERDYKIECTCFNPLMDESDKTSSIRFSVYSVRREFDEFLSTESTRSKICNGIDYNFTMKSTRGYWLPENIEVLEKPNGAEEYVPYSKYTYSMYTGEISLPSVNSNIRIIAKADEEPILKRVEYTFDEDYNLEANFPKYSEKLWIYLDDEVLQKEERPPSPVTVSYESVGTTYGFKYNLEDGYYWPECKGISNGFSIIRVVFENTDDEKEASIIWMQDSESGYDFGIIGLLDTELTRSNSEDSKRTFTSKSNNQTTPQRVVISIPSGKHFYEVKYRKDGSVNNNWDAFIFKAEVGDGIDRMDEEKYSESDGILRIRNNTYEKELSANVTHHVYVDGEELITIKEGI